MTTQLRPWWGNEKTKSMAWLGLFLPGLSCYAYFLSLHLNQYPEVEGSQVERFSFKLDKIIPVDAKVRNSLYISSLDELEITETYTCSTPSF